MLGDPTGADAEEGRHLVEALVADLHRVVDELAPSMTEPPPDDLAGFTVALDPATRLLQDGTVVMGGSPLRVMRLTVAGADLVRRLASGEPVPAG